MEAHLVLELLYNHKHKRGRSIVDNAFGILKQTFIKFLKETNLHITIVLDVFSTCCLLHNLLLRRKDVDVDHSCERFKLKVCKMLMHKISIDYIMEGKMFTFRAESFLGNKTIAIWRFILMHNIISNV